jgi:hypothetical protein
LSDYGIKPLPLATYRSPSGGSFSQDYLELETTALIQAANNGFCRKLAGYAQELLWNP